jgi:hypothetical protein
VNVRYYLDPETDLPHIYGHGVSETEAEYIIKHRREVIRGRNDTLIALGQTAHGRYLQVVYSPDPDGDGLFVLSAYPMHGKHLKAYRKRRRKRG